MPQVTRSGMGDRGHTSRLDSVVHPAPHDGVDLRRQRFLPRQDGVGRAEFGRRREAGLVPVDGDDRGASGDLRGQDRSHADRARPHR